GHGVVSADRETAGSHDYSDVLWQVEHPPCFRAGGDVPPRLYGAGQETDPFLRDATGAKVLDSAGPNRFEHVRPLKGLLIGERVQSTPRPRHCFCASLAELFTALEDYVLLGTLPPSKQVRVLN